MLPVDSLGSVLVCSARQYSGALDLYRAKKQRRREEDESAEAARLRSEALLLAERERERQASVKKVCDRLRSQAQFLAERHLTKTFAEDVNRLADLVESSEAVAVEDLLAAIKESNLFEKTDMSIRDQP